MIRASFAGFVRGLAPLLVFALVFFPPVFLVAVVYAAPGALVMASLLALVLGDLRRSGAFGDTVLWTGGLAGLAMGVANLAFARTLLEGGDLGRIRLSLKPDFMHGLAALCGLWAGYGTARSILNHVPGPGGEP